MLSDDDLRKGIREIPINLVQTGQNTMEQGSMSSPWPARRRRWRVATVNGCPTPRRERPPVGAAQLRLALAVACPHAEAVHSMLSRQR